MSTEDKNDAPAQNITPATGALRASVRRLFGRTPHDIEGLVEILRSAESEGIIGTDVLYMIEGALAVSNSYVRDIMIPRTDMVGIKENDSFKKVLQVVIESGHSRFPVFDQDNNKIKGILLAKDLLASMEEKDHTFNIKEVIRPSNIVPWSKRLNVLLREFRQNRSHMAIVIDEYNIAVGLVTIEDILEEIIGDIVDEHDVEVEDPNIRIHRAYRYQNQITYVVKAKTTMEELSSYFNEPALNDGEQNTIGGFIVSSLGRVPKRGEFLSHAGFDFSVIKADKRRIRLLRVIPRISGDPS